MSVEAISWALSQPVERSSAKFVLVAMANCAGPDLQCWPSMGYLTEATSQDRKTVLENVKRLIEAGYIAATDGRKGKTNQVVVYQLQTPSKDTQKRNSTENGTVPKTEAKSPVFPAKESRFSVQTVPKTGHGTVKEPSENRKGIQKSAPECAPLSALVAAGFDEATAAEFIAHKARLKAPLTARAWADHLSECRKAGWTPMQAAIKVIAKNWKGFEAKYVAGGKADEMSKWIKGTSLDPDFQGYDDGVINAVPAIR